MKECTVCQDSINVALSSRRFAVAHLYNEEKTMDMHIHGCYEVYYSISGGKQFFIDNKYYSIQPGDAFVINQFESHCLTQIDHVTHERIVISIHPAFVAQLSTAETDLATCFHERLPGFSHRLRLDKASQHQFVYLINKISRTSGFGADAVENSAFVELMVMLNRAFQQPDQEPAAVSDRYPNNKIVGEIIDHINQNITAPTTLSSIAEHFYISDTHLCRLFKAETGTTVNKYVTARRISIAKSLLAKGHSVAETCELSGFNNYANFIRSFSKTVGIPPKRYGMHGAN